MGVGGIQVNCVLIYYAVNKINTFNPTKIVEFNGVCKVIKNFKYKFNSEIYKQLYQII